jgi:hypothetical protein
MNLIVFKNSKKNQNWVDHFQTYGIGLVSYFYFNLPLVAVEAPVALMGVVIQTANAPLQ